MKHILILITLIVSFSPALCAQQISQDFVPTPNASDLGKYGNINVSHYTGHPDFTIPLHVFKVGNYRFPISLRHDASGVLVNSMPGWTGCNWTLQAGGVIVRTKYGTWDEADAVNKGTLITYSNYFNNPAQLLEDMGNDNCLKENIYYNRKDYSPDIFTFNFLGKTGKFFLGNDGQWKVYCDDNIDVVFDVKNKDNYIYPFIDRYPASYMSKVQKTIKGFTLRDDNGYVYVFGGDTSAIDYSLPFFRQMENEKVESFFPTCWYLTSVRDKYGNELYHLDYERGAFVAQFYNDAESILVKEYRNGSLSYGNSFFYSNDFFPFGGTLNAPVYLKRISHNGQLLAEFVSEYAEIPTENLYPHLDVTHYYSGAVYDGCAFYYLQTSDKDIKKYQYPPSKVSSSQNPLVSTRSKLLRKILIGQGPQIKLDYSADIRHFLKEISMGNVNDKLSYKLKYNYPDKLPQDFLSYNVDDWGFYNKGGYATEGINPYGVDTISSLYGTLTEVTYPTGGKSVLEYESNDYSSCMSANRDRLERSSGKSGGLRIRKITEYDDDGTSVLESRRFSYSCPATEKSSGELFASPVHSWTWRATLDDPSAYSEQTYYRKMSIIPLSSDFGTNVGYSIVRETRLDDSYKIYRYQNISSSFDERFIKDFSDGKPSPFDMYTERGYKRGKLISVESYSSAGKLLLRMSYGYPQENVENDSVLTSNIRRGNFGDSATFGFYSGGIYKLLFPKYDVVTDTLFTYYDNGVTCDINTYKKKDDIIDIQFKYPHKTLVHYTKEKLLKRGAMEERTDYEHTNESDDSTVRSIATDAFDISPYAIRTYRNGRLLSGTYMKYAVDEDSVCESPVLHSVYRINSDGSMDETERYGKYNKNGHPQTLKKAGIAEANLSWSEFVGLPSSMSMGGADATDNIYMNTNVIYTNEGKPLDVTYPNSYVLNYEYDDFGRLTKRLENYLYVLGTFNYNFKQ